MPQNPAKYDLLCHFFTIEIIIHLKQTWFEAFLRQLVISLQNS